MTPELREHMLRIATPTAVGLALGKRNLGFPMAVPPHIAYVEQKVLEAIYDPRDRFIIVTMPPRHSIAHHEPVLTLQGWKTHGELVEGDHVFRPSGGPTRVTAVAPDVDIDYRITMTDGSTVDCDGEHLWTVHDRGAGKERTLTTRDMAGQRVWSGNRARFQLPHVEALRRPPAKLPIDPYLVGAWLGDGTTSKPQLTLGPEDADHIKRRITEGGKETFGRDGRHAGTGCHEVYIVGLIDRMRQINLLNNKRIPEQYMFASVPQRRALLEGLVDTDGSCDPNGRIRYVSMSQELAQDVVDLALTLGYAATLEHRPPVKVGSGPMKMPLNGYEHTIPPAKECWVAQWTPHDGLGQGSLPRKQAPTKGTRRKIGIRSIERLTESVRGNCITVDAEDGLYCVGRRFTPTHNSKSFTLGRLLPLWYLGMFPDNQVMYTSYADDFAGAAGEWVRDMMKLRGNDLFGHSVSKTNSGKASWKLDQGYQGGMLAVGRGAALTGLPAHLAIADDLLKNSEEANSNAVRKGMIEWYDTTFRTRLEPGGTMLLFFTRWRVDDLIGTLIERSEADGYAGDQWEVINLPALAEAPLDLDDDERDAWRDELGRRHGEALWPERYPEERLNRIRANNPATFQSMYQGDPRLGTGGWFPEDRWVEHDVIPEMSEQVRVWDLAATKDGGDWTVGMKLGRDAEGNLWVLDIQRFRKDPDEIQKTVRSVAQADGNHVKILIEQERAGSGKTVLAMYKTYLVGFTVEGIRPEGSKEERAKPANEFQSMRRCFVPKGADWLDKFKKECSAFLKQKTDDQVDAFAYGFAELIAMGSPMEMWTPDIYLPMSASEMAGTIGASSNWY